jgi:hypothetical protein
MQQKNQKGKNPQPGTFAYDYLDHLVIEIFFRSLKNTLV